MADLTITVTCRSLTPMFVGFDQEEPELDAQPVTAMLRWWVRALAGTCCFNELQQVKLLEEAIFGSQRRASAVRVDVDCADPPLLLPAGAAVGNGVAYLGGQGVIARQGQAWLTARAALQPQPFTIRLCGRNWEVKIAYAALLLAARFDGLGARKRKGFGAFAVTAVHGARPDWPSAIIPEQPNLRTDIAWASEQMDRFRALLVRRHQEDPRANPDHHRLALSYPTTETSTYPALRNCRAYWFRLPAAADGLAALQSVGQWIYTLRRVGGRPGTIRGIIHTVDYDAVVAPVLGGDLPGDPRFDIFGLPIPYKNSQKQEARLSWRLPGASDADEKAYGAGEEKRRASPVILTLRHAGEHWLLSLYLDQSAFLPAGAEEIITTGGRAATVPWADTGATPPPFIQALALQMPTANRPPVAIYTP